MLESGRPVAADGASINEAATCITCAIGIDYLLVCILCVCVWCVCVVCVCVCGVCVCGVCVCVVCVSVCVCVCVCVCSMFRGGVAEG